MAVLIRHARILYLLALFQLLGGPLVLGGLMMITRLMADREMTLTESVSKTLIQLDHFQAHGAGDSSWAMDEGLLPPAKPELPSPRKSKESKDKLWVVNDLAKVVWAIPESLKIPEGDWHDPVPWRLAHAPPIPPPKWS